jgi:capsular polysaccharide biosynthesis protein
VELRIVAAAARRWAAFIVLLGIVTAVIAVVGLGSLDQRYRASATLLLDPTAVLVPGQQVATGDPERYVDSQLRVLSSAALAERAAAELSGASVEDVQEALSLTQITGSDVVDVSAEAATPEEARDIANAVADAYVAGRSEESTGARQAQVEALDAQIADLQLGLLPSTGPEAGSPGQQLLADQIADLQTQRNALGLPTATQDRTAVLDPATTPTASEAPSSVLVALAGGLVGLLAGTMLATLQEARHPHVMSAADAHGVLGLPVVAEFAFGRTGRRARRAVAADVVRPSRGSLRRAATLAATVTGVPAAHEPRRLAVCGTSDSAESWQVATALSVALARQGARVALVPLTGDPAGGAGQDAAAAGDRTTEWTYADSAEHAVTVWRQRTSDGVPPAHAVTDLLAQLPSDYDVAVLHVPPVLQSPLATQVAADADRLVLTIVAGDERMDDLELAHRTLAGTGVPVHPVMVRPGGRLTALNRR